MNSGKIYMAPISEMQHLVRDKDIQIVEVGKDFIRFKIWDQSEGKPKQEIK